MAKAVCRETRHALLRKKSESLVRSEPHNQLQSYWWPGWSDVPKGREGKAIDQATRLVAEEVRSRKVKSGAGSKARAKRSPKGDEG